MYLSNCVVCSAVSKGLRRDQDAATMILDMTNQLIPHMSSVSQCGKYCSETLANGRTTLVNTFGVYWTKRGDLFNPPTRCAIVRCMTNFILVSCVHAADVISFESDRSRCLVIMQSLDVAGIWIRLLAVLDLKQIFPVSQ